MDSKPQLETTIIQSHKGKITPIGNLPINSDSTTRKSITRETLRSGQQVDQL
jgi:hypothetical protein